MAVTLTVTASAKKNKAEDLSKAASVYIYGLSSSFNDSTVYITDLQLVDSAFIENKKFLGGMKEYTEQMNTYFTGKGLDRRTNVVFFKTKATKAEKAYVKLRRRYTTPDVNLVTVGINDFLFKAVHPTEVTVTVPDKSRKERKPKGPDGKGGPDGKRPPMGGHGGMGGPGGGMGGPGGGMGGPGGGM